MNRLFKQFYKEASKSDRNDIEARTHNSTYPKGGVSCSKDSFVVNGTLVFQIKFSGKSPALRVAAKRYGQCQSSLFKRKLSRFENDSLKFVLIM